MPALLKTLVVNVLISCGVILGGTLLGTLGGTLSGEATGHTMLELAGKLKIWALAAGMGGTFDTLKVIETGLWGWEPGTVIKQFLLIFASFVGAHAGYLILCYLSGVPAK